MEKAAARTGSYRCRDRESIIIWVKSRASEQACDRSYCSWRR